MQISILEGFQFTLDQASDRDKSLSIGDIWEEKIENAPFGRIAAQTAKQVISQKVREAERQRQFHEYKDRVGEIVVGTIKRVENHSITIDLDKTDRDLITHVRQIFEDTRLGHFKSSMHIGKNYRDMEEV